MIKYEQLLDYPIPEGRQTLSRRDVALYALSVGLGQDPMDVHQLPFVDSTKALPALPFMAVVLAQHGFWMAEPRTGIDVLRVVHGEQSMTFHAPLPVGGEVIGRSRIVDVIDKGEGKGALIYLAKELVDAASGKPIATLGSTVFARGNGGFDGPTGPVKPVHALPDTEPDCSVDMQTRPEQALYYRLNGDYNPLHSDPAVAAKAGYPRPILHGLCTLGLCGHALLRTLCDYDPARLSALALRFTSPVLPGDTVRVDIWRDGSFRARVVERDVTVINNGKADIRQANP
jgi:acyl dehydratase